MEPQSKYKGISIGDAFEKLHEGTYLFRMFRNNITGLAQSFPTQLQQFTEVVEREVNYLLLFFHGVGFYWKICV
jgi:hypothetical protein